ncbi:retrovirus-related Pol polyprotein from transposon RE1 [Trichonephila clavipes]|nr:retrovirus-related Pol polyprotein from transposon RE1 [Trichonephila clavipes]
MDWPARSQDLNPIAHVWDFLGRRLAARTLPPVTIRELRLALQDEWAAMPQQLIDTLILSMGRRDLSEQQEALMVEVTIPNCYKQAIRSRDASKWDDAMDKEINVMKERKVWDLVDHPDNIKILENRWVYTIKYDENNKIV